jgi:hypothetical protein
MYFQSKLQPYLIMIRDPKSEEKTKGLNTRPASGSPVNIIVFF